MRVLTLTACALALAGSLSAQSKKAQEYYNEGRALYDDGKCPDAIKPFERALREEENYNHVLYYLGECYYFAGRHDDAIELYSRLDRTDPGYWAYYYYYWGRAHETRDEWDEAARLYEIFLQKYDSSATRIWFHHQVKSRLAYARQSPELRAAPPTMGAPMHLGGSANSDQVDFAPMTDPTGRVLYFTSQRKGGFDIDGGSDEKGWGEDIWRMYRTADGWSTPELLPEPINSKGHDGLAAFSGDGQTMVYTACGRDGGVGNCDLYVATLEGTRWTQPRNLGNTVNSDKWDSQPSLSADGSAIYFVSDRPGGYGQTDVYVVRRNQFGDWAVPMNLGPIINTPFHEYSPVISPDGKTLYYASAGHPGLGNMDLFVTVFENGTWSIPRNLGAPLNSAGDDRYFTIGGSGEVGYFASDREGGLGGQDLYEIVIPEDMRPQPTVVVSGTVTNAETTEPLGAWVLVEDLQNGDLVATYKSNQATGKYLVVLPAGRDYSVSATTEGFFFYSQRFTVGDDARYQEITRDIPLSPIAEGATVVLNNVFFETGSADLSPVSRVELGKVVDLLMQNPSVVIEVGGHTDNVGSEETNMRLSHNRALSVRQFLVSAGVPEARVQAKGYGETNPVASNETEEGRQANRRTEIIIIEG
jgi:outer membrane protein OmpA-like peptidoglycan-associated protein